MAILSSDVLRGHVEAIILNSLSDGKKYGYEIRGFIESKSKGLYKPNEQSVYSPNGGLRLHQRELGRRKNGRNAQVLRNDGRRESHA